MSAFFLSSCQYLEERIVIPFSLCYETSMNWKRMGARLVLAIGLPPLILLSVEGILRHSHSGWPTSFTVPAILSERAAHTDNQFFGFRFFPPNLVRTPAPLVIQPKSDDVIRIVLLGESAAMGDPLPEYGMARILQKTLETRHPSQRFEVINAAMTAINSHVIREIVSDLRKLAPDVFILYMGHNEVVGPFGPGTVLDAASYSPLLTRARVLLSRTHTAQKLRTLLPFYAGGDRTSWAGMEMFQEHVAPNDPRLRHVYRSFKINLNAILREAHRASAAMVLCTVASNLKDCAPFSNDEESLQAYQQGLAAVRSNQWKEAYLALSRARDLDTLRFRADSTINRIIRHTAQNRSNEVHLADMEAFVYLHSKNGLPGHELFLDHVHFNFEGNRLAASFLAEAVEKTMSLPASPHGHTPTAEECARLLFYTPWSEYEMITQMIERYIRPPFSTQRSQPAELAALQTQKEQVLQIIQNSSFDEFRSTALQWMQRYPDDWVYPAEWGKILLAKNRLPEAGHYFKKALEKAPHRYDLKGLVAMTLALQGKPEEGIRLVEGREPQNSLMAQTLIQTARQLSESGRLPEAVLFLQRALIIAPRHAEAQRQLAACEARRGRIQHAEAILREALQEHPEDEQIFRELIALLLLNDRKADAENLLQQTKTIHPETVESIRNTMDKLETNSYE
jgi:tetratricopeptide (TPR) repeat protein